jgi:dTDP-4-dehydrorhamnose reductase
MRILVTGRAGQLGWELERSLQCLGHVVAVDRSALDLAAVERLPEVLERLQPTLIVNAAAYTAVDKAEAEPELARRVNADAPRVMAQWAAANGTSLIHYSTDYVFDGFLDRPYVETDAPSPLSVYGRTKLDGEDAIRGAGCAHLILRTSWVYGMRGRNFLRTMVRLAGERDELRIVNDQCGAPTWSRSIAEATAAVVAKASLHPRGIAGGLEQGGGVFHLTCQGSVSWHGFAQAILRHPAVARPDVRLVPIPTSAYPTPARRPKNSRLSGGRLKEQWGIVLPDWDQALALCLGEADAQRP